jgi:two-component system OmpR family response regulator
MAENRVLVVEDDQSLLSALRYNLEKESYEVVTAEDGVEALETARRVQADLILLDIILPRLNDFEVCRILRKESSVPILMLTAKDEVTDKIVGLEIGADDYVTKPFSMRELLARIRAMLRRTNVAEVLVPAGDKEATASVIRLGNLEIDMTGHRASLQSRPLSLTPKEFDLLAFLAENRGLVFNRGQLLERVWGYDFAGDTRTVDVHIRWLRQKIEEDPSSPRRIITVRGTGYKLEA